MWRVAALAQTHIKDVCRCGPIPGSRGASRISPLNPPLERSCRPVIVTPSSDRNSEQDGAHRLGGDAPAGELPAHSHGGLGCQAMTRDGTVGRSDATERSLALRWDVDPVRMMRPRLADFIRASSRFGLHQQAGHMTASDLSAERQIISCQAGGHCRRGRSRQAELTALSLLAITLRSAAEAP